jgi:hypothetical protein
MNCDKSLQDAVEKYGVEDIMKFLLQYQYDLGWQECNEDVAEGL